MWKPTSSHSEAAAHQHTWTHDQSSSEVQHLWRRCSLFVFKSILQPTSDIHTLIHTLLQMTPEMTAKRRVTPAKWPLIFIFTGSLCSPVLICLSAAPSFLSPHPPTSPDPVIKSIHPHRPVALAITRKKYCYASGMIFRTQRQWKMCRASYKSSSLKFQPIEHYLNKSNADCLGLLLKGNTVTLSPDVINSWLNQHPFTLHSWASAYIAVIHCMAKSLWEKVDNLWLQNI